MPSTSDAHRARFPRGETEATAVLENAGYQLDHRGEWHAPANHEPTARELDAIGYLLHEWDYGFLVGATNKQVQLIWDSARKEPVL